MTDWLPLLPLLPLVVIAIATLSLLTSLGTRISVWIMVNYKRRIFTGLIAAVILAFLIIFTRP